VLLSRIPKVDTGKVDLRRMLPAETDGDSGIENGWLQSEPGLYLADAGEGFV
jgi:hypothetical protein